MYLHLNVSIEGSEPPIFRQLIVSDELTFQQLHNVLQIAFDWSFTHLYLFQIDGYTVEIEYEEGDQAELNVFDTQLNEFPLTEGMNFEYIYDFGDDWVHKITIEKITDMGPDFPVCIDGERNSPPEDIGGMSSYIEILNDLKNGTLDEDFSEWLGEFDPEYCDIDEINDILSDPEALEEDYM